MTSSNTTASYTSKTKKQQLSKEQIQEFKQAFDLFDVDENGRISHKELKKIMQGLGQHPTEVEVEELIHDIDSTGDGSIDWNEFLVMINTKINSNENEDDLKAVFKAFDKGGRGKIGINELREVMLSLGEDLSDDVLQAMIDEIDDDNDGYVTFENFKQLMNEES